jgi:hypothetical protein
VFEHPNRALITPPVDDREDDPMQHRTRTATTCPGWCTSDHAATAAELDGNPGDHLSAVRRGTADPNHWDIYATATTGQPGMVAVDLIRARPGVLDLTPAEARILAGHLLATAAITEQAAS